MILKKYYCKTNLYGLKLKKLFLIWTLIKVILFLNLINEISYSIDATVLNVLNFIFII